MGPDCAGVDFEGDRVHGHLDHADFEVFAGFVEGGVGGVRNDPGFVEAK